MSRVGVKHSLALSAVSALLVTGLGAVGSPASAADVPPVVLLSQADNVASTAYDGYDNAVRVTAAVANPDAVVTFEYNRNPQATDEDPGWSSEGFALMETPGPYAVADWTPPDLGPGAAVALRVAATVNDVPTTYSTRNDVVVNDDGTGAVALGARDAFYYGPGEFPESSASAPSVGYFPQPYADSGKTGTLAAVSGTTSADTDSVAVSWRRADGTFGGGVDAAVTPTAFKVGAPGSGGVSGGVFTATLDLTGLAAGTDVVAFRAVNGSDVVQPTEVFQQTLGAVSVDAVSEGDGGSSVTLRVEDEGEGNVVGAEVRRLSDGSLVGYTGQDGTVTATESGRFREQYYANTTDVDAYGFETDPLSRAASNYEADPSVAAVSADGTVFDRDEYAAGDVYLQVTDQEGRAPADPTEVYYRVQRAGETEPGEYQSGRTDARGRVEVPLDVTGADGDYVLDYQLDEPTTTEPEPEPEPSPDPDSEVVDGPITEAAEPAVRSGQLDFTIGEAVLSLSPDAEPDRAAAGGQLDYVGRLAIGDKVLAGRSIDLGYTRAGAGDAGIVTPEGLATSLVTSTGADGTFTVVIDDPASSTAAETGRLDAETGVTRATEQSTVTGDAGASTSATTSFTATATPTPTPTPQPGRRDVTINLRAADNGAADDRLVVRGPAYAAGETIAVRKIRNDGSVVVLTKVTLNAAGDAVVRVKDYNGRSYTKYAVRLVRSPRVEQSGAGPVRVR